MLEEQHVEETIYAFYLKRAKFPLEMPWGLVFSLPSLALYAERTND